MQKEETPFERKDTYIHPSINGLLGIISFSTRIPINRYITIEEMAGTVILWPFVGLFIGIVGAVVAYLLQEICLFEPLLSAVIIYSFILWFTGFNHLDGVLDMGDGLMAHGEPKRRLEIMRDSMVGTGGIATFFIVASLTIAALSSIPSQYLIFTVILMEAASKLSMITSMLYGDDDSRGIGREIKFGMDYKVLILDAVVLSVIGYYFMGIPAVVGVLSSVFTGFYMSYIAQKNFGCVTGDIMGASNEIARLVTLLFIILSLNILV